MSAETKAQKKKPILIFINRNNHNTVTDIIYGIQECYINPVDVYIDKEQSNPIRFYINNHRKESNDKRVGTMTFKDIYNFSEIKKYTDQKLINSIVTILNMDVEKLKPKLLFSCWFPVSDIPINELKKFQIITIE